MQTEYTQTRAFLKAFQITNGIMMVALLLFCDTELAISVISALLQIMFFFHLVIGIVTLIFGSITKDESKTSWGFRVFVFATGCECASFLLSLTM